MVSSSSRADWGWCGPQCLSAAHASFSPAPPHQPRQPQGFILPNMLPSLGSLVARDWTGDIQASGPSRWKSCPLARIKLFPLVSGDQTRASGWLLEGSSSGPRRAVPALPVPQGGPEQCHQPRVRGEMQLLGPVCDSGLQCPVCTHRWCWPCLCPPRRAPLLRELDCSTTVLSKLNFFIKCQGPGGRCPLQPL